MSTVYGGYDARPPRRVNFGWIGEAWNLFGQNAGLWILAVLVATIIPTAVVMALEAMYGINNSLTPKPLGMPFGGAGTPGVFPGGGAAAFTGGLPPPLYIGVQILSYAWFAFIYGGVYRMAVKQVRGEALAFSDIFSGGPVFWRFLGFYILYSLASGIGFVLCIIPGLLVAGLLLPGFALVADGLGLGDALNRSVEAMKGDLWNAALLILLMVLIIIVGIIPCGLGSFVTLPMFWIVSALAYRDMVGMPGWGGPSAPPRYGEPAPGVWPPPPGGF